MNSTSLVPPDQPESPGAAESERPRLYSAGDIRLLVLDDDPAICRLVQAAFAPHDFQVEAVSDPNQVESKVRATRYHVVILDYVLPGLETQRVLDIIREEQPEASIIVITAFPTMDSALQCLRAHTHDYITKPFQVDHLKRTVLRCLESRGLLRLTEEALREQLGTAIRERRKSLGLTLADLAKRSGVSLGYLSQIELGKNSASIETLYRITLGLRLRLADLFQTLQTPM